jgi:hypothetical protein
MIWRPLVVLWIAHFFINAFTRRNSISFSAPSPQPIYFLGSASPSSPPAFGATLRLLEAHGQILAHGH